jgi:alkylhydroperoxidase family enzyme
VPVWREASCFGEVERLVLEYAEAMTATPAAVDDTHAEQLRRHLSEAQLVELTATVALENLRSRSNRAYGLASQGFAGRLSARARRAWRREL